jgi:hypothetical protein
MWRISVLRQEIEQSVELEVLQGSVSNGLQLLLCDMQAHHLPTAITCQSWQVM